MDTHLKNRYTPDQLKELATKVEPDLRKRLLFIADCIEFGFKNALANLQNTDKSAKKSWAYLMVKAYNYGGVAGLSSPTHTIESYQGAKPFVNEIFGIKQTIRLAIPSLLVFVEKMNQLAIKHEESAKEIIRLKNEVFYMFQSAVAETNLVFDQEATLSKTVTAMEILRLEKDRMEAKDDTLPMEKIVEMAEFMVAEINPDPSGASDTPFVHFKVLSRLESLISEAEEKVNKSKENEKAEEE